MTKNAKIPRPTTAAWMSCRVASTRSTLVYCRAVSRGGEAAETGATAASGVPRAGSGEPGRAEILLDPVDLAAKSCRGCQHGHGREERQDQDEASPREMVMSCLRANRPRSLPPPPKSDRLRIRASTRSDVDSAAPRTRPRRSRWARADGSYTPGRSARIRSTASTSNPRSGTPARSSPAVPRMTRRSLLRLYRATARSVPTYGQGVDTRLAVLCQLAI